MGSNSDHGAWKGTGGAPQSVDAKFAGNNAPLELPEQAAAHEMETPPVEMSAEQQQTLRKPPTPQHSEVHL
jgi:hypothetical protein